MVLYIFEMPPFTTVGALGCCNNTAAKNSLTMVSHKKAFSMNYATMTCQQLFSFLLKTLALFFQQEIYALLDKLYTSFIILT